MIRSVLTSLLCVLLVLVACSDSNKVSVEIQAQKADSSSLSTQAFPYQVLDRFDVGNQVYVRALAVDAARKQLWVGTTLGALQIDIGNAEYQVIKTYTRKEGLANEYIFSLLASKQGDVWLGTNGGGVSRRIDNEWKTYFPMHGLADYWVYSFAETDNTVWIGTWAGLSRYDRETGKFQTYLKELVNEWVYGLDVDDRGRVWIGTEGGMNMFDGRAWSVWTHKDGLGAANKDKLPASRNTGLGTRNRHDLSVLSLGKPTYNPNYVFCVLVDDKQRVWAGTWGGGVAVYDGQWRNFTQADGLGGNIVYSLNQDAQKRIWAGTNGGVSVYDGQQWFTMNKARGLGANHVYAVEVFEQHIWLGIRGAVLRLGQLQSRVRRIP